MLVTTVVMPPEGGAAEGSGPPGPWAFEAARSAIGIIISTVISIITVSIVISIITVSIVIIISICISIVSASISTIIVSTVYQQYH